MSTGTVTAVAMAKGGVGRTTIAVNVAERLAAEGLDVVLVDLTLQGGATTALGEDLPADDEIDILNILSGSSLDSGVRSVGPVDLLPSTERIDDFHGRRDDRLETIVELGSSVFDPARDAYDHVVVDTPPFVGVLSDAALVAADVAVLPVGLTQADLAALELTLDDQVIPIRERTALDVAAIVPTRLRGTGEERRTLERIVESGLGAYLPQYGTDDGESPDGTSLEAAGIKERVAFSEAWREAVPLGTYDPDCDMLERIDHLAATVSGGGSRA